LIIRVDRRQNKKEGGKKRKADPSIIHAGARRGKEKGKIRPRIRRAAPPGQREKKKKKGGGGQNSPYLTTTFLSKKSRDNRFPTTKRKREGGKRGEKMSIILCSRAEWERGGSRKGDVTSSSTMFRGEWGRRERKGRKGTQHCF